MQKPVQQHNFMLFLPPADHCKLNFVLINPSYWSVRQIPQKCILAICGLCDFREDALWCSSYQLYSFRRSSAFQVHLIFENVLLQTAHSHQKSFQVSSTHSSLKALWVLKTMSSVKDTLIVKSVPRNRMGQILKICTGRQPFFIAAISSTVRRDSCKWIWEWRCHF